MNPRRWLSALGRQLRLRPRAVAARRWFGGGMAAAGSDVSPSAPTTERDPVTGTMVSPVALQVMRGGVTEPAFSAGSYEGTRTKGIYVCRACFAPLFDSAAKFDSKTGWPSFSLPLVPANVAERPDTSHGMHRTEVLCGRCAAHGGHVFRDGPGPQRLRYCINSAALRLVPRGDRLPAMVEPPTSS